MNIQNLLISISLLPLIGIIFILLSPNINKILFFISFITTNLVFFISVFTWILFDSFTSFYQFQSIIFWFFNTNIVYNLGIDGISLFFVILTTLLINLCLLISFNSVSFLFREFLILFLILEFCLIQVFCVLDLFFFYVFFESTLIPMFLIIGIWGSRNRKIRAAYQLFLFTLVGSLLMLISIIFIYSFTGSTDLKFLLNFQFPKFIQLFLWLSFFFSLAVKIPMVPFHLWLPEAHAEAPTAGSVILAGILLKIGGYGFLRFSIPLFPEATIFFSPLVFILSLIAIIYGSLTTLRQIDLKKIIAYSSIAHMGFVTIGIFSLTVQGIEGSILLMISHGFVSSALFFCIGILYDRYSTRIIKYYSGLVQSMPLFSIYFFFFLFANIGFPCTSSFVSELLILIGLSKISLFITFLCAIGIILSAAYSIWLLNRVLFGILKLNFIKFYQDISRREFFILFYLTLNVFWIGLYPNSFLNEIHFSTLNLLEFII